MLMMLDLTDALPADAHDAHGTCRYPGAVSQLHKLPASIVLRTRTLPS